MERIETLGETNESLKETNKSLKETNKSIKLCNELLMKSNAVLKERSESQTSDLDAALKKLDKESSQFAQSSKRLEEAMKKQNRTEFLLEQKSSQLAQSLKRLKKAETQLVESSEWLDAELKKETNKSLKESNKLLMESNAALKQRLESQTSGLDAALKKLEQKSLQLAQSSKRLEEALKRVEPVKLSLNVEEALHIIKALDLRQLFTTLRDKEIITLNAHLPEGESDLTTYQEHMEYSDRGGRYTGHVTSRKVLDALDKVTYDVTQEGNRVAHGDRLNTEESKTAAYEEATKIVTDASSPGTKNVVLEQVQNHLNVCSPVSRGWGNRRT
jgi:DNA repair exonuclease SbcCD ATPase subunit